MKNPTVNLARRHSRQFLTLAGTVSLGLGVAVGCAPAEDHTIATTSRLAANTPPSADAGPDQTIIWPAAAMLNGAVSDDWLPDPPGTLAALWTVVSGPGDVAFRFDYDPKARARFSAPGVYVLRLTASDTELSTSDDVVITVEAVSYNQAPFIDVGTDPPVIFPRAFEAFLGVETWDDGLPVVPGSLSVLWEQVSGPSTATIRAPTAFTTSFTVPTSGEYRFRVTVSDGELSTTAEYLLVGDDPPRTDAGPDQTITLPATVALHGTVTDDGFPREFGISHIWFMLEGPAPVSFGDEWALDTTATFSTPGRYVIMLSGSDGAIGDEDTLEVTVLPASGGLTVSAGPDRTTILPAVAVVAARVDYPGRPPRHSQEAVSWQQVSGPGTASFANPDGRLSVVRFSAPGQYVLRVTVTNGPLSGVDDIVINVRPYSY